MNRDFLQQRLAEVERAVAELTAQLNVAIGRAQELRYVLAVLEQQGEEASDDSDGE